ncbi:uncharacterized protein [Antedon mediterranea]|uniref:uncharacterized protein n=1 Tax=Antedon mediterranea TaxID=105859 RepID=UPI003AF59984
MDMPRHETGRSQTRVMLWSTPRALSTAFLRSIHTLDKCEIFNEPFMTAWHFGPERKYQPNKLISFLIGCEENYSYQWIKEQLEREYVDKDVVFCKDFAYAIDGNWDAIPKGYKHTFLIRDPSKVMKSWKERINCGPLPGMGLIWKRSVSFAMPPGYMYEELHDLFIHLRDTTGEAPLILDADDLLADPKQMMRKYCKAVGLTYREEMLHWEPEEKMKWHVAYSNLIADKIMGWYSDAMNSDGIRQKSKRSRVDMDSLPDDVREVVKFVQPFYDVLYNERLRLDCDIVDSHATFVKLKDQNENAFILPEKEISDDGRTH